MLACGLRNFDLLSRSDFAALNPSGNFVSYVS